MDKKGKKAKSWVANLTANIGADLRDRGRCGDHVSSRATVASVGIQLSGFKRALADPAKLDALIAQCREENAKSYEFPRGLEFDVAVDKQVVDGCEVVTLNSDGSDDQPRIVYLIGGAYLIRADKSHWQFLNRLAKQSHSRVVVPLYPLLPQQHFEDAYQFMTQLYTDAYNQVPVSDITLMGDSAGAGFATGFCEYLGQRGLPQPGNLILISPWLDATLSNKLVDHYGDKDVTLDPAGLRRLGKLWAGDTDPHDYRISPLNGDVSHLRKVTVFTGTHELMYPDVNDFVRKLRENHVPVDYHIGRGLFHIYPLYDIPESEKVMSMIVKAIQQDELSAE